MTTYDLCVRAMHDATCADMAFCDKALRAALQALADNVSGKMVAAGEGYSDFVLPDGTHDNTADGRRAEMKMAFQTMIRAALEEE